MKVNPWARRQARRAGVQALYEWQMSQNDLATITAGFEANGSLKRADRDFFGELLRGVVTGSSADGRTCELDEHFAPLLDRKVSELDKVELAILRLGSFELAQRIDVPYRVVIDEYVELAKVFGAEESHKYINGVLDKVAAKLRTVEIPPA